MKPAIEVHVMARVPFREIERLTPEQSMAFLSGVADVVSAAKVKSEPDSDTRKETP